MPARYQVGCSVPGCSRVFLAKGLCGAHYYRLTANGSPDAVQKIRVGSLEDYLRFTGWTITDSECWEWRGTRSQKGYGSVSHAGRNHLTHRVAYETWVGPIPEGHVVRHKCDNPPCINPDHLETGTHRDNAQDKVRRGRHSYGMKHPAAKLTEQDVLDIRREYGYGVLTQQMLADVYGVSDVAISHIVRHKTWTHIGGG